MYIHTSQLHKEDHKNTGTSNSLNVEQIWTRHRVERGCNMQNLCFWKKCAIWEVRAGARRTPESDTYCAMMTSRDGEQLIDEC